MVVVFPAEVGGLKVTCMGSGSDIGSGSTRDSRLRLDAGGSAASAIRQREGVPSEASTCRTAPSGPEMLSEGLEAAASWHLHPAQPRLDTPSNFISLHLETNHETYQLVRARCLTVIVCETRSCEWLRDVAGV